VSDAPLDGARLGPGTAESSLPRGYCSCKISPRRLPSESRLCSCRETLGGVMRTFNRRIDASVLCCHHKIPESGYL
jgi:hypothetical protein